QLVRFRESPSPLASIAAYLHAVQAEASLRGYRFDATKIISDKGAAPIVATYGQIEYEWGHFIAKLRVRDPAWLEKFTSLTRPRPHPLFQLVPGAVADWEVIRPNPPIHLAQSDKAARRR
ncbi:MAG: hypothetical protein PHX10_12085, partial [Gallionellaceae bacterium]|nr:hypothetical protein [Gallionellaceae bacterium]